MTWNNLLSPSQSIRTPQPQDPRPVPGVASISPTVHVAVEANFPGAYERLVVQCKKDGMLAVYCQWDNLTEIPQQCFAYRDGQKKWDSLAEECVRTHIAIADLLSPTIIHIGKAIVVVQTDESRCFTLVMVYEKAHPIAKSVRRNHRLSLSALRKGKGYAASREI